MSSNGGATSIDPQEILHTKMLIKLIQGNSFISQFNDSYLQNMKLVIDNSEYDTLINNCNEIADAFNSQQDNKVVIGLYLKLFFIFFDYIQSYSSFFTIN